MGVDHSLIKMNRTSGKMCYIEELVSYGGEELDVAADVCDRRLIELD